jgi:uncharacterized protein YbjQ (UPF0145 family)
MSRPERWSPKPAERGDLASELRHGAESLHRPRAGSAQTTSDLSIDEELAIHSIGWEPVELVVGTSVFSVPSTIWNWGQGEIAGASAAHARAFAAASAEIHRDAAKAGGHGIVGVHIDRQIYRTHIDVSLVGTAVRPVGAKPVNAESVFVSDLAGRDFSMLMAAGWRPLGLVAGAAFVYAPRRSAATAIAQKNQNVELTNLTEAMYSAREAAMERMQAAALTLKGFGVVEVKVSEGPMGFASHAVGFTAWGTVVRLAAEAHQHLSPMVAVSLDDAAAAFDAKTLR